MSVSIVVSRYNEDLQWLRDPLFAKYNIFVYNKGINDAFYKTGTITSLPNIGRCDHTYIYHIVQNYHELDDIVVFLPGSCGSGWKKNKMHQLMNTIQLDKKAVFPCDAMPNSSLQQMLYNFTMDTYKCTAPENFDLNKEKATNPASIRPFGKWFEHFFPGTSLHITQYGGILSANKSDIRQRPIELYQQLIAEFKTDSNPEVGHYMERSYAALFHPLENTTLLVLNNNYRTNRKNPIRLKKRKGNQLPNTNPSLLK